MSDCSTEAFKPHARMEKSKRQLRADFIAEVREFAEGLAKEYRCDIVTVDEDRQKGVWGEGMTKWLEEKCGGDCSTNITWDGGLVKTFDKGKSYEKERHERRVELRFRFDSPCVSVWLDYRQTFAELQFSDYLRNDDGEFEHTGMFALHETHAWGYHGGMPLLEKMVDMWEEEH